MKLISLLSVLFLTININAEDLIDKENLEFFKTKHVHIINSNCSKKEDKKECFYTNIKSFYSGLNLFSLPNGQKYYLKCYQANKDDKSNVDYINLNNCTKQYNNILSYDFLDKKYNYIFLEEDKLIQSLTIKCTTNQKNEGNIDLMNRCILKERKSFKFFKANYFSSSNNNVEEVFGYCLNKYQFGTYSFSFSGINSCIRKNTYNF